MDMEKLLIEQSQKFKNEGMKEAQNYAKKAAEQKKLNASPTYWEGGAFVKTTSKGHKENIDGQSIIREIDGKIDELQTQRKNKAMELCPEDVKALELLTDLKAAIRDSILNNAPSVVNGVEIKTLADIMKVYFMAFPPRNTATAKQSETEGETEVMTAEN